MLVFDWKRRAALFALGVILAGFGACIDLGMLVSRPLVMT